MGTIKRFDLSELKSISNITTFIETGTHLGDGVEYALQFGFDKIISIEIDEELVNLAKDKFKNHPSVTILQGNSFTVLETILPNITDNILFWLDAHFPGADLRKKSYNEEKDLDIRLPFERELKLIYETRKQCDDIIIADDLWLYEDENLTECGNLTEHFKRCNIPLTREDVVTGKNLDFIRETMSDKWVLTKYYQDQGYMLLTPTSYHESSI